MPFLLGLDTAPMEARSVASLPESEGWQFEPKWDGFRCLAFKAGREVELRAKSGKPLGRYFPEMVAALQSAGSQDCVLDGELVVAVNGALSFSALQDRLHPADSRIRKLAAATPSALVLFDCLAIERHGSLLHEPLVRRRATLDAVLADLADPAHFQLTPATRDRAEAQVWLDRVRGDVDGIIAKRAEGPYAAGERAMLKIKHLRTADCVVGGFRYEAGTDLVGSLLLGLFDEFGKLNHVGFTSSLSEQDRPELTSRLQSIQGTGFTGNAPGGPSRWNTQGSTEWVSLRPELVVEVRYDHVTGNRFRHGTRLVRWRPDKRPDQCTLDQLGQESAPAQPRDKRDGSPQ